MVLGGQFSMVTTFIPVAVCLRVFIIVQAFFIQSPGMCLSERWPPAPKRRGTADAADYNCLTQCKEYEDSGKDSVTQASYPARMEGTLLQEFRLYLSDRGYK